MSDIRYICDIPNLIEYTEFTIQGRTFRTYPDGTTFDYFEHSTPQQKLDVEKNHNEWRNLWRQLSTSNKIIGYNNLDDKINT